MSARSVTRILAGAAGLALVAAAGQASFSGSVSDSEPTYVVQPGDSLWSVAAVDGLSVDQLAAANGLPSDAGIEVGMALNIPPASFDPGSSDSGSDNASVTESITTEDDVTPTAASTDQGSSSASSGTAGLSDAGPPSGSFCSTFSSLGGPVGILPSQLQGSSALSLQPIFVQWADFYGISPSLLEAIAWQESGWQQEVVSPDDAVGIGQIIPSTAAFIDDDLIGEQLDPTNASDNIRMSAAYLGFLSRTEDGNLCDTIAAYYEGSQNLEASGVFAITVPYVEDVEALMPRFE